MKNLYTYIGILLLVFSLSACSGSKRMYKQGQELESAGMYEDAARSYMDALRRDNDNIEALIALRSVGQIVVDDLYADFFNAVQGGENKAAIDSYLKAENFRTELRRYNVNIERPSGHEEEYRTALSAYLEIQYQNGRNEIGRKNYSEAEAIFIEIQGLQANYKDTERLLRIAQARPVYQEAMDAFDSRQYRKAYRLLDEIERTHGEFDESAHYKAVSLRNGQFGLGIMKFENHTEFPGVEALLSSRITRQLQDKDDPFLKLIDRTMMESLTAEQIRAMTGQSDMNSSAETGQLLGAKAILVGELVSMDVNKSNLRRVRRPGYIGRRITRTNAEGDRESTMVYDKVWYYDVSQELRASAILQFKIVSVETGEILLTDAITVEAADEVDYSTYNGDTRYLYMGEWRSMTEPRASDRIYRDSNSKRQIDSRLEGRRELRSESQVKEDLYDQMSSRAANEIYNTFLNIVG